MIYTEDLLKNFLSNNINFFTGVPDSILKNFLSKINKYNKDKHIVAVNEGSAVSIGIGYYLSTKKIPCIYMQNSGLGNSINPLISIAHKNVYSIPLLLLIGWRGAPGTPDEPQHITKGKITTSILKSLGIKYHILKNKNDLKKINKLTKYSLKNKKIVACLIKKNTLKNKIDKSFKVKKRNSIFRYEFLSHLLDQIKKNTNVISTTGYTSREIIHLRNEKKIKNGKYFYMVGGMGHSLAVSLGVSLNSKNTTVCVDGDGSILMHLGSMRSVAYYGNSNLKHIVLNNNSHESVGGISTNIEGSNLKIFCKGIGYKNYFNIKSKKNSKKTISNFLQSKGPSLLEVKISNGSFKNLLRPNNLIKIKNKFLKR